MKFIFNKNILTKDTEIFKQDAETNNRVNKLQVAKEFAADRLSNKQVL